jgi:hypothetical protein
MMLDARRVREMLAPALKIALVREDGISDGQGFAVGSVRLAACQRLARFAGLMERQDVRAIGILAVIGDRKTLGPVCSVTIRGLDHPRTVGPIPAVKQHNAASQRRPRIRLFANRQTESCAATL